MAVGANCPVPISGNRVIVLLSGCGAVGARAARQLVTVAGVERVIIDDPRDDQVRAVCGAIGGQAEALGARSWEDVRADVVVLAMPPGHGDAAGRALSFGAHVVSVSDSIADARALLAFHTRAFDAGRAVVIGAGFAPGLSCLLAVHAGAEFASVDEIHVAKLGTAGPTCARQHHEALRSDANDWRDGRWVSSPGGSGRELCWFPDPVAGADCYRAALADPLLLQPAFPTATRITARMAATRRDRLTSRLPMLRPPHAEAGAGAIRVEVRGRRDGVADAVVFGVMDRPSVASGAMVAVAVGAIAGAGLRRKGAGGVAEMVSPLPALLELARRGVKCARFEGAAAAR